MNSPHYPNELSQEAATRGLRDDASSEAGEEAAPTPLSMPPGLSDDEEMIPAFTRLAWAERIAEASTTKQRLDMIAECQKASGKCYQSVMGWVSNLERLRATCKFLEDAGRVYSHPEVRRKSLQFQTAGRSTVPWDVSLGLYVMCPY